ncbi:uncharacterized protein MEPE_03090 [Melanopsichium pennsylvanicum]|uniref:Uncharacterized protein n=1 Tax=Melanopsichium pennsylvanicum TaxID=63383 RepID=A0AAJ4XLY9_9BASI|nr:uncharacterized protein MEPE_03090 [Melanopsichium pennsylvanicum]
MQSTTSIPVRVISAVCSARTLKKWVMQSLQPQLKCITTNKSPSVASEAPGTEHSYDSKRGHLERCKRQQPRLVNTGSRMKVKINTDHDNLIRLCSIQRPFLCPAWLAFASDFIVVHAFEAHTKLKRGSVRGSVDASISRWRPKRVSIAIQLLTPSLSVKGAILNL